MESPPESDVDYFAAGTTEKDQGSKLVKEANLEQKVGQVADEHESLPHHLKRLFLYCSLFPSGYEFSKDELIQLWIAEGFIRERQNQRMEDTASEHFNSLEKEGFFLLSRCDFTSVLSTPTGNFLYKVNPIKHSILGDTISSGNYFRAVDGQLDGASKMTRHLSLICEDIDGKTFGILQNFKHLRTLHLLSCRGSSIKHVPRDFCFTLTFLRTLNLSGTLISELPSSIGNVKSLRYIDASHTPISRLPESIDSLHKLQTIKLRGCTHFVQLPKGMKKLSNLRHIDLDIIRQLDSMPAHLGNLRNLQTLPAFLVGRDDGCHVGELKNLNDLKGAFNISRLENVLSKEEAGEAALMDKKGIHSLELRWSNLFVEYAEQQVIVLECLQPHSGLKELQIQQYSGSVLPTWISNPAFTDLVVITLYKCRNCKLLPCMGQLPALNSLSIIEVNEVKEINHQFFRNGPVDHAFPKLQRLEVDIMLNLKEWKDVQMGDLPSLVKLTLDSCPELVTIPPLSCLKFLKHLEFRRCPNLMSLPNDGLPTSLESFLIVDCLELKQWCLKSEHRSMLCHLQNIWFDHEDVKGDFIKVVHINLGKQGDIVTGVGGDFIKGVHGDFIKGVHGDFINLGTQGDIVTGVGGDIVTGVGGDFIKGVHGDFINLGKQGDIVKDVSGYFIKGVHGDSSYLIKDIGGDVSDFIEDVHVHVHGDFIYGQKKIRLPRFVVLKAIYNGKCLRLMENDGDLPEGFVKFEAREVVSQQGKFELVTAKSWHGLVHIRCCYNNKYLVRFGMKRWIVAAADEPEEDKFRISCTLFKPELYDESGGLEFRFRHIQLGMYACLWRAHMPFYGGLYGGSSEPDKDACDVYTVVDWKSLDVKPADNISDLAPEPADLQFFPRLRSGCFTDIGPRKCMEDEHILIDDLSLHLGSLFSFPTPSAFYGVFDGHGGPEAAIYVQKNVMRFLFDDVNFPRASEVEKIFSEELENTLRKAFHQLDLALADDGSVSGSSGTTALTAMIFGRLLMVANGGDCRAVLCRKGQAIDMSRDHRPIYPLERKRIEELGGYVDDGYLNGVCSVSRALGDWDIKFPRGSVSPLIAEPEFRQMDLTEEDEFLIIGCDGIWDVISSQYAVSLVRRGLRQHDDPEQCAKDLVMEALRRDTSDNLTVIVVCFSP